MADKDPSAIDVKTVLKGESITLPVKEGMGFVRKPAVSDGLYFSNGEVCFFVPASEIRFRMTELEVRLGKNRQGSLTR